jgi:hypothetical protein
MDLSFVADRVRLALRNAGYKELEPGRRGFVVEAEPQGGWVAVACHIGSPGEVGLPGGRRRRDRDLQQYRDILSAAGFTVTDSPLRTGVLRVTLTADSAVDY